MIIQGDLVKILNNLGNKSFIWYKNKYDDVTPIVLDGPFIATYIGIWNGNITSTIWHEVLFNNKILLVKRNQIKKVKI